MRCLNCEKEFSAASANQLYCCEKCGRQYRKTHDANKNYPVIGFTCSHCGKAVVTEGGTKDKRTRFCSHECEKKYWKHRSEMEKNGISERTNYHSLGEYLSYEKRTNEDF